MTQIENCEAQINTVVRRVETLMILKPRTRNSDKRLIIEYLIRYHNCGGSIYLTNLLGDESIPSFESITRARRIVQAKGKCLAADSVKEIRRENEVAYANVFGKE